MLASWRLVIVEEKGSGAGVFCRAERFCALILVDGSVIGVTPQCAAPLHGFVSFRSETWGDALGWHGFAALVLAWAFSLWQALPLCERCELRARQTGSLFAPWQLGARTTTTHGVRGGAGDVKFVKAILA